MSYKNRQPIRVSRALLLLVVFVGIASANQREKNLPPDHEAWLKEEVVYIITEKEREVFLELETIEERMFFIDAFWRKRDSVRATPVNEFKEEHYRRLAYANKFLGRETFIPGWKTDRGRYYIILGEPRDVQRFDGNNDILDSELWFYQAELRTGLPPFFYLLFFKRRDMGEYVLYSPIMDGPTALVRSTEVQGIDNRAAAEMIRDVNPELASASLSFDPSDPPDLEYGMASLGTDLMIARVEESPKRAIRNDYTDAYIRYGDMVSTEYSFNFVPSRSFFAVLFGPQDTAFVHYSIELDPENFSMELNEEQNKYYTTLDVGLEVRDMNGRLILERSKVVPVELASDVIRRVQSSPISYQDNFLIVDGQYQVTVIIRNRVLKQFTVAERELTIEPLTNASPMLSEVVLGYGKISIAADAPPGDHRAFRVEGQRVQPAAGGLFAIGETVQVFAQVQGASPNFGLRVAWLDGEETLDSREATLADYGTGPAVEELSLLKAMGGNYEVVVELLDPAGTVVAARRAPFTISPLSEIPRPGIVYRRGVNPLVPGLLQLERGEQLLALQRFDEATRELEAAVAANNPRLPSARWKLAGALLRAGEADRVLELLQPMEDSFSSQFEVVAGLGFAHYLKNDCASSQRHLEKAITIRPPDTTLLNILGNCYQRTEQVDKALEILERSLQMNPDQGEIRQQLNDLPKGGGSP
jgi:GWxTD domain-containing protein